MSHFFDTKSQNMLILHQIVNHMSDLKLSFHPVLYKIRCKFTPSLLNSSKVVFFHFIIFSCSKFNQLSKIAKFDQVLLLCLGEFQRSQNLFLKTLHCNIL
uniref:(northern house mosquito) hypothetical protein n=1 Tax=Culex pipiens TaxID=7175 RepID=A0A8D8ATC1_CULPI